MTPREAQKPENQDLVWSNLYNHILFAPQPKAKFKINDLVRISKVKSFVQKGYERNFSKEVFRVRKVLLFPPVASYCLEDLHGELIG